MRIFYYLLSLLVAVVLAACGGGGGSPGLSSGPISAFSVVAPAAVTLQVGSLQTYAIRGGVKPYTQISTDPAVAIGWIGGDDVLYVGTLVPGKATITTVDAKGSKFDIAVTAGSSTAFYTTAPTALTISPVASAAQTYVLGGGVPPYTAVSSFPRIASVTVNGNSMTITGNPVGEQDPAATANATITMRDAAGATLTSAVTVATAKLTLSISTAKAYRGDVIIGTITGGTPPYRAQSGIDGIVTPVIVNGNQLQVTLERIADPVTVSVFDANNQRADASLTIIEGAPTLRISPAALTINETSSATITLVPYGVSGTPTIFSSDVGLLTASWDSTNKVITVNHPANKCVAANTDVTITLVDAKGFVGTSVITIKDNGNASTVAPINNCPT